MKQIKLPIGISVILCMLLVSVIPSSGEKLPKRCTIQGIPYVEQMKNYCGPAALAMVLNYWGVKTDQEAIGKKVYDQSLRATNGADMIIFARDKGCSAYSWNSSLDDLKEKLTDGVPVIVLQDSSVTDRSGHYRVVTGYDDNAKVFFIHDPYEPQTKEMPYDLFQSLWQRHGNWSLLVCSNERDIYKRQLNDLNPVVHIDLAYVYYMRGNHEAAERECSMALEIEPSNFYAQTLYAKSTRAAGKRSNSDTKDSNARSVDFVGSDELNEPTEPVFAPPPPDL
ncbi:MAG TPA: C39 family peptidase [Armatimonadota bacterium]|nr:C39 family peptidase [Armatimonadota bacterium]HOM71765.1 C39 family peptidase [Armatimonadota bacterium]HOP79218.1 C39 family peptidase [Armatimonadota bacterium]